MITGYIPLAEPPYWRAVGTVPEVRDITAQLLRDWVGPHTDQVRLVRGIVEPEDSEEFPVSWETIDVTLTVGKTPDPKVDGIKELFPGAHKPPIQRSTGIQR